MRRPRHRKTETPSGVLIAYIDRSDLAKQLDITERTLARWHKLRIGPPITQIGRRALYHVDSVAAWLRSKEMRMVREKRAA